MQLKSFSVEGYKIFKDKFTIDFLDGKDGSQFTILTGKNNSGKSTLLEAINKFFEKNSAGNKMPGECFNKNSANQKIVMEAELIIQSNSELNDIIKDFSTFEDFANGSINLKGSILLVKKEYTIDNVPKLTDTRFKAKWPDVKPCYWHDIDGIVKKTLEKFEEGSNIKVSSVKALIEKNAPYYIYPQMDLDEIKNLITKIYSDALNENEELESVLTQINEDVNEKINSLKEGKHREFQGIAEGISEELKRLFNKDFQVEFSGFEDLEIDLKTLQNKSHTTLKINSGESQGMELSEQGTGVQRTTLVYTIQKMIDKGLGNLGNKLLMIDEPEAFLHPEAVRALSKSLYDIGGKMPIIITTHSPILINLENDHTRINIFKVNNNGSQELFRSSKSSFSEEDIENIKILNYVDSYVNEFFFSDKIIIVEGDTEAMVLNYIKRHYDVNFHVIRARGKSTIVTMMKVLNQFKMRYYVLFDLDNDDTKELSNLKSEQTKSLNIFSEKGNVSEGLGASIFATNHTFEKVFYGEIVDNREKTQRIFEILSTTEVDANRVQKDILTSFNSIFDLEIREFSGDRNSEILEIDSESIIKEQFFEKIKEKTSEMANAKVESGEFCNMFIDKDREHKEHLCEIIRDYESKIRNYNDLLSLEAEISQYDLGSKVKKFMMKLYNY